MDKINTYRKIIQNLLKNYASDDYQRQNVDREFIFDVERDHYQIVNVGWEDNEIAPAVRGRD
jgi:hypothetical protein